MVYAQHNVLFWGLRIGLAATLLLACASLAMAQTAPANVVRVEESWALVVGVPSPEADAPQVTSLISPFDHAQSTYATFVVNHHNMPQYKAGGLELQTWYGDRLVASQRAPNDGILSLPDETITWTQSMALENGQLVFRVQGNSTTWGAFGADNSLMLSMPADLANLNSYDPQISVANSGVSFAANRVASLVLQRVRLVMSDGTFVDQTTPRIVYP